LDKKFEDLVDAILGRFKKWWKQSKPQGLSHGE